MNYLHLQETAKHYANLAEQYRSQLAEEQQLNEDLLGLVEALCEELDIDVETLLEMAMTKAGHAARVRREDELSAKGKQQQSWSSQDRTDRLLRSDKVHDEKGKVVHSGARGLGYSSTAPNPSDEDLKTVKSVVGEVGHIVGVADDDDYATGPGDTKGTADHAVYKRLKTPMSTPPARASRPATALARSRNAVKKSRKSRKSK